MPKAQPPSPAHHTPTAGPPSTLALRCTSWNNCESAVRRLRSQGVKDLIRWEEGRRTNESLPGRCLQGRQGGGLSALLPTRRTHPHRAPLPFLETSCTEHVSALASGSLF